jgi:hypothetical protein
MKIYKPCATLLPAIANGRNKPSESEAGSFFSNHDSRNLGSRSTHYQFEKKVFGAYTLPFGDRCCSKG